MKKTFRLSPSDVRFEAILSLAVGLFILFFAVSRVVTSFLLLPGDPILNDLQFGKEISLEELEYLAKSRERALKWSDSGRVWTDLARVETQRAYAIGFEKSEGKKLLNKAAGYFHKGLSLSPANPFAWASLGYVEIARAGGSTPEAVSAIEMSISTGTYEPRLFISRLELFFTVWRHLTPDTRKLVAEQVRIALRHSAGELVSLAKRSTRALVLIRASLLKSPAHLVDFNQRYNLSIRKSG